MHHCFNVSGLTRSLNLPDCFEPRGEPGAAGFVREKAIKLLLYYRVFAVQHMAEYPLIKQRCSRALPVFKQSFCDANRFVHNISPTQLHGQKRTPTVSANFTGDLFVSVVVWTCSLFDALTTTN